MIKIGTDSWKIENIELVIFDKDGTFIDIHTYWGKVVELRAEKIIQYFSLTQDFFEPLCEVMGYDLTTKKLPADSPVGLYVRGKVQEILLYFLISKGIDASLEDINIIFEEVHQTFISEQDKYTKIISPAYELIEKLYKKVKMVVVTSDSKFNATKTIEQNGLRKYFDGIFGAEDSKTPKTSGEIIKTVLKKLNIAQKNTICIGDTHDDYLMAKNSEISCINVATGVVPVDEHLKYNRYSVKDLSEISLFN